MTGRLRFTQPLLSSGRDVAEIFDNEYLHKALKYYYGHEQFRPGQEKVINCILDDRNVLAVFPTGAGKSICFQLPALLLPGVTLVISPLVSLMKDQTEKLKLSGINAAYLDGCMCRNEYGRILHSVRSGECKILYVVPERLRNEIFRNFIRQMHVSFLAVDEAHCVSRWGHTFREDYGNIPDFIKILPVKPRLAAFTATATEAVCKDILEALDFKNSQVVSTGFDRENLFFSVERAADKTRALLNFLEKRKEQNGIVYCGTRAKVGEVADLLRLRGYTALRYHAGLTAEERRENQKFFTEKKAVIMVATNAFGMGIDKADVRFVVHYNMPKDVESYYQEAGRAGRDGEFAECHLLYNRQDIELNKYLIMKSGGASARRDYELQLLHVMSDYCNTSGCLRNFLLRYFGDAVPGDCKNCGNCANNYSSGWRRFLNI